MSEMMNENVTVETVETGIETGTGTGTEMMLFHNEKFGNIRSVVIDGEPWFVGKDVAAALGYKNSRDALKKHVDDEDKSTVAIRDGNAGNPNQVIINESGVYALIFGSKLESAKEFKHWVTSEVLPSIRKNGGYIAGQETLADEDLLAKAVLVAHKKIQERDEQIKVLTKKNNKLVIENKEMKPKADFHDDIAETVSTVDFGKFSAVLQNNKKINFGRNKLMDWCRKQGYLCQSGRDKNKPKQMMLDRGLMAYKESTMHKDGRIYTQFVPLITGKGQIWLTKKLLESLEKGEESVD